MTTKAKNSVPEKVPGNRFTNMKRALPIVTNFELKKGVYGTFDHKRLCLITLLVESSSPLEPSELPLRGFSAYVQTIPIKDLYR